MPCVLSVKVVHVICHAMLWFYFTSDPVNASDWLFGDQGLTQPMMMRQHYIAIAKVGLGVNIHKVNLDKHSFAVSLEVMNGV